MCIQCMIQGKNLHTEENDPYANESHYDRLIRFKAHHEARLAAINQLMNLMETTPEIKMFLEIEDSLRKEN